MKTITNHKMPTILILFLFLPSLLMTNYTHAQEAQIWKKYTGAINDPNIPLLPNYGYAGYKLGAEAIPDSFNYPVFDVTNYGAVPNDANSDQAAIQAAIDAAGANGRGIVFFPPGEFLVNTDPNHTTSITIASSHIILKGSGSTPGGTVINMKNHMLLPPGNPTWAVPPMIDFTLPWSSSAITSLTHDADRGDHFITVGNASLFQGRKYCRMEMPATTAANSQFLEGKTPRSIWSKINNDGINLIEFHEIESIDVVNNRVYFKDPIVDDMKVSHGWKARGFDMMEGSGFEDIHFKANFLDNFVHHKDYIHNAGWNAIKMSRVAHCWVRRSRFTDVTGVASFGHAYASSMIMLLIDGNRGHTLTSTGGSTRILQGLIWDNTNNGQWHGPNMSGSASGSVVWRIEATKGRGFDLHGSFPRTNLIDLYTSVEVTGNGGAYQNLPNHVSGLTIWNQKRVGANLSAPYNFWENCGGNYCGIAIVNPIVVGYHGSTTTFVRSNVKYEESNGTKVSPASLYEAQVEHRLGARPAWMDAALTKYAALKSTWYHGGVETFGHLTLTGWGQETYTGDNGKNWHVAAKGVSGYINSSKGIYFQSGKTGVVSDSIPGGIASFSVKCKDLWDTGNPRTIQLLINGAVVGSMNHTGSEIYDFTVNNINMAGHITMAIKNASSASTNNTIAIDDISWTSYTDPSTARNVSALNRPITASSKPQTGNPAPGLMNRTGLNVYPNPFYSTVKVQFGEYHTVRRILLTDIHGKIIFEQLVDEVENQEIAIDLTRHMLSQGWYLLKITEADRLHTFKLSKLLR